MSHERANESKSAGEQLVGEWLSIEESASILQEAKSRHPNTSIELEDRYFHVQIGDGKVLKIPAWKKIDVVKRDQGGDIIEHNRVPVMERIERAIAGSGDTGNE